MQYITQSIFSDTIQTETAHTDELDALDAAFEAIRWSNIVGDIDEIRVLTADGELVAHWVLAAHETGSEFIRLEVMS